MVLEHENLKDEDIDYKINEISIAIKTIFNKKNNYWTR